MRKALVFLSCGPFQYFRFFSPMDEAFRFFQYCRVTFLVNLGGTSNLFLQVRCHLLCVFLFFRIGSFVKDSYFWGQVTYLYVLFRSFWRGLGQAIVRRAPCRQFSTILVGLRRGQVSNFRILQCNTFLCRVGAVQGLQARDVSFFVYGGLLC